MKTAKLFSLVALILITASLSSAQVTVDSNVDSNNDACWQSLSSLRACQIAQQQLVTAQTERCTSFPEYQCTSEPEAAPTHVQAKKSSKAKAGMQGGAGFQAHKHISSAASSNPNVPGTEAFEVSRPR